MTRNRPVSVGFDLFCLAVNLRRCVLPRPSTPYVGAGGGRKPGRASSSTFPAFFRGFCDYKKKQRWRRITAAASVICVLWFMVWSAYRLLPCLLCRDGDVPAPEHKGKPSLLSLLQPITSLFKFLFHLSCSLFLYLSFINTNICFNCIDAHNATKSHLISTLWDVSCATTQHY